MREIKNWLTDARKLEDELTELREAKQRAYELLTLASSCTDREKVSGTKENLFEKNMVAYIDYSRRIERAVEHLLRYKNRVLEAIGALDDGVYKTILTARYINCKTWEEISENLRCDLRWVYRMHNKALEKIAPFVKNNGEIDH